MRGWLSVKSGCCDYKLSWRGLTAIPRLTRTSGIATARWPRSLASRGISRGPMRWHDDASLDLPEFPQEVGEAPPAASRILHHPPVSKPVEHLRAGSGPVRCPATELVRADVGAVSSTS